MPRVKSAIIRWLLLSLRLRWQAAVGPAIAGNNLFWAVLIGWVGGLSSAAFREANLAIKTGLTGQSGDIVTMWSLYDLKDTKYLAKKAYQSTKFQMEFQCKKELVRLRGMKFFTGKMGEGQVIYNESFTDIWTPITDVEPEWYFACYNR